MKVFSTWSLGHRKKTLEIRLFRESEKCSAHVSVGINIYKFSHILLYAIGLGQLMLSPSWMHTSLANAIITNQNANDRPLAGYLQMQKWKMWFSFNSRQHEVRVTNEEENLSINKYLSATAIRFVERGKCIYDCIERERVYMHYYVFHHRRQSSPSIGIVHLHPPSVMHHVPVTWAVSTSTAHLRRQIQIGINCMI